MNTNFGECHAHIALDGVDYKAQSKLHKEAPNEEFIRTTFNTYLENDITFIRDGGDKWGVSSKARLIAKEYEIDYRTPIFAIYKNGGYGSILGKGFDTMKEFKVLVKEAFDLGADFIKIMASGIMDFNEYGKLSNCTITPTELKQMIKIVKDNGLSAMVHVNGDANIKAALESGADSIEHGYYMERDTLNLLKENDAIWVPTLTPVNNLIGVDGFNQNTIEMILNKSIENIKYAFDLEANVGLGSDAGSFKVPHVLGIKKEYELLSGIIPDKNRLDKTLTKSETLLKIKFVRA